ncbi:MAG: LAGLIDADG family homing endonuclease [Candidatus Aenigmatarchaeota archaeon]
MISFVNTKKLPKDEKVLALLRPYVREWFKRNFKQLTLPQKFFLLLTFKIYHSFKDFNKMNKSIYIIFTNYSIMKKYSELSEKEKMYIYALAIKLREQGLGQRKISNVIKKRISIDVSEATVSGWIHYGRVPGKNKATWFKPKAKPPKKLLVKLYKNNELSASALAKKFNTSAVTVINWLKSYGIKVRTHKEAMRTKIIKEILREKHLFKPTKKKYENLVEDKAYILGVLCGDGHINPNFIRLEIKDDEEFIKKFVDSFKNVYGIECDYWYYPKRNTFVTYITSHLICADLRKYGKFGRYDWTLPREVLKSDDNGIIRAFLKGFFDSEGSVGSYVISVSSVNKKGLIGVKKLLSKLGIRANLIAVKKGKYFVLYISRKENIKKFKQLINFTINRKRKRLESLYKE